LPVEDTLDRRSARLSRGPRGTGLGGLRATVWELPSGARAYEPGGGDRGVRGGRCRSLRGGRKRHRARIARSPKWEARREARFSPVSFASGGPEPPGAFSARLRTRGEAREEDVRVDEHGAARFRDESDPRTNAERHRAGTRSLRWEATEHECSSWNGFGVQKSIGRIAGRDARGRYQAHHGHARPSSKESLASRLTRGTVTRTSHDGARVIEASSNHGDADWLRPHAQASSGSHPEGCGLGDSGSPRAASARLPIRWKGVRVEDASL